MGMMLRRRDGYQALTHPAVEIINNGDAEEKTASPKKYTKDELMFMTVKAIKELASKRGIVITKLSKLDVVNEFLDQQ